MIDCHPLFWVGPNGTVWQHTERSIDGFQQLFSLATASRCRGRRLSKHPHVFSEMASISHPKKHLCSKHPTKSIETSHPNQNLPVPLAGRRSRSGSNAAAWERSRRPPPRRLPSGAAPHPRAQSGRWPPRSCCFWSSHENETNSPSSWTENWEDIDDMSDVDFWGAQQNHKHHKTCQPNKHGSVRTASTISLISAAPGGSPSPESTWNLTVWPWAYRMQSYIPKKNTSSLVSKRMGQKPSSPVFSKLIPKRKKVQPQMCSQKSHPVSNKTPPPPRPNLPFTRMVLYSLVAAISRSRWPSDSSAVPKRA